LQDITSIKRNAAGKNKKKRRLIVDQEGGDTDNQLEVIIQD
jgi:hypothetical protein